MVKIILFITALLFSSIASSVVYQKTQQSDIYYFQSHRLLSSGEFEQAIVFSKKSLAIKPHRLDALKDLAYAYQWTGQHNEAIEYFRKILSLNPKDIKIEEALAFTLAWEKQYDEAISIYQDIIKTTDDYGAKVQLAEVLIWHKEPGRAEQLLRDILKSKPRDAKARLLLANALLYTGKTEEAGKIYDELLKERKILAKNKITEEQLHKSLGEAYMISKDYEKAISEYRKILQDNPLDAKTIVNLADILSWQLKYDESIKEYEKALLIEPDNLDIKEKLATTYCWKKDYGKSEEICKDILKEDPHRLKVYALLGQMLSWQKRYTEAFYYFNLALAQEKDKNIRFYYAEALFFSGEYTRAKEILEEILAKDPDNLEAKTYLADAYAYSKEFKKAILLYGQVLQKGDDPKVKRKLADTLSWDKQYKRAIGIYDELLREKEGKQAWLQKARVLGWERKYTEALKAYQELSEETRDPLIALEMKAKKAYWDSRVKGAIDDYEKLITLDSENEEAMFDLSQIYSYQSMWKEAIGEYEKILNLTPTHFRAKQGVKKARLLSRHLSLKSGYESYEADSAARMDDLKRYSFFNKLVYPREQNLAFSLDYRLTNRLFSDFGDVLENEGRFKLVYLNNPSWRADAFYDLTIYNKDIHAMHTFGTSYSFRLLDKNTASFSYERKRLENNSTVIRERFYSDNFKGRVDADLNKRMKLGADYLFTNYSDGNNNHQPGIDLLYRLSLEPKSLTLKYRYFYQNFLHKQSEYFSPKGFSTNSLKINWRHFLNKDEIFFGANDLYYDLAYEASVDSTGIVCHKFSTELNWDINKRLNLNIKGSDTQSSANVYRDKNIMASLNYYF